MNGWQHANYEELCKAYEEDKMAPCSSLYFWAFLRLNKPLSELHVLDAGCRTGKYALAMLEAGVGQVTMQEGRSIFLEKAIERCGIYMDADRAHPNLRSLPKLPYPDETFDCVMFNYAFHRNALQNTKYSYFQTVILEARKIIKPGGLLLLNMTFPNQYRKGYWYYHLAPNVLKFFAENQQNQDETLDMLKSAMFVDAQILVDTTALYLPKELYFDPDGPINDKVRRADLFWDKLNPSEQRQVGKKIISMNKSETIEDYITKHDKERVKEGQVSLVLASKRTLS